VGARGDGGPAALARALFWPRRASLRPQRAHAKENKRTLRVTIQPIPSVLVQDSRPTAATRIDTRARARKSDGPIGQKATKHFRPRQPPLSIPLSMRVGRPTD
jgi:hypothetical protein